jgi:hypothetical protein
MAADGHICIFWAPDAWLADFLETVCRTQIPGDILANLPDWQRDIYSTFYVDNSDSYLVYWDTEDYNLVINKNLSSLDDDTMKHLRERYQGYLRKELDITVPITEWIYKFLSYFWNVNDEVNA